MKGAYLSCWRCGCLKLVAILSVSVHLSHVFPLMTVNSGFGAPNIPVIICFVIPTHEGKDKRKFSDLPKTA